MTIVLIIFAICTFALLVWVLWKMALLDEKEERLDKFSVYLDERANRIAADEGTLRNLSISFKREMDEFHNRDIYTASYTETDSDAMRYTTDRASAANAKNRIALFINLERFTGRIESTVVECYDTGAIGPEAIIVHILNESAVVEHLSGAIQIATSIASYIVVGDIIDMLDSLEILITGLDDQIFEMQIRSACVIDTVGHIQNSTLSVSDEAQIRCDSRQTRTDHIVCIVGQMNGCRGCSICFYS